MPEQGYASYEYHIYLNRLCTVSESLHNADSRGSVSGLCLSSRMKKLVDGHDLYAPNALIDDIAPFNFSTVNLTVPFAFYILTALSTFVCLLCAPFGGKRLSRPVAICGTVASGVSCLLFVSRRE